MTFTKPSVFQWLLYILDFITFPNSKSLLFQKNQLSYVCESLKSNNDSRTTKAHICVRNTLSTLSTKEDTI